MNPYETWTVASITAPNNVTNTQEISIDNVTWDEDEWVGFSARKVGCVSQMLVQFPPDIRPCGLIISSNTAASSSTGVLTVSFGNVGTALPIVATDQIHINKVTEMLDSACRGQGTLLHNYYPYNTITRSGTTATVITVGNTTAEMGLADDDWVFISDSDPIGFRGTYQIDNVTTNSFTYVMGNDPGGDSTSYTNGISKVPSGWNDQVTEKCYQWLNTSDFGNMEFAVFPYHIYNIREDDMYYNYTSGFDGSGGMGAGARGSRPGNCTTGTAWWASDQGTWNSLGDDGVLDVCTATNTWTNAVYTPLPYPHPLLSASGCGTPAKLLFSDQPASALQGVSLGPISVGIYDSSDVLCTTETDTVTLAKTGGTCTGMTLNGTVSGAASDGIFTTSNVNLTVATGSCTLTASAAGLTDAVSSSVTITSAPGNGRGRDRRRTR